MSDRAVVAAGRRGSTTWYHFRLEDHGREGVRLFSGPQLRHPEDLHGRGVYGIGDATLNGRELAVASYLTDHVIPCLIGRDPHQIEDIWQYLYRGAYWRNGPVTMGAISAVDIALWDIKGKALEHAAVQAARRQGAHRRHGVRPRQRRHDCRDRRRGERLYRSGLSRGPRAVRHPGTSRPPTASRPTSCSTSRPTPGCRPRTSGRPRSTCATCRSCSRAPCAARRRRPPAARRRTTG